MKINKRALGSEYEDIACSYLENEGFRILERNYRVKTGEIDIIALDHGILVFAEVKYRSSVRCGGAPYAISKEKQKTIIKVARWYMAVHKISEKTICRFDAVLIEEGTVTHIKNAWQL